MRIRVKKPNGKWGTVHANLSERKAKDLLVDIYKNLIANRIHAALAEDGMKISFKARDTTMEYAIQD